MTSKLPPDEVATAYDVWADVYDSQTNATRDLDARILRELDPALFRGDVLEIGCGTGKNTEWMAPRARSLLALDASEQMLKRARERSGVQGRRCTEDGSAAPAGVALEKPLRPPMRRFG